MSDNLGTFLIELAVDADRLRRYSENPGVELALAGLTADEQAAVLSGDADRIRIALGEARSEHFTQINRKKGAAAKKSAAKQGAKKTGAKKKKAAKKR